MYKGPRRVFPFKVLWPWISSLFCGGKKKALGNEASASSIHQGTAWTNSTGCVFRAQCDHAVVDGHTRHPWSFTDHQNLQGEKNAYTLHLQRCRYRGQKQLRSAERAKATWIGKWRIFSVLYLYSHFHPMRLCAKWACSSVVTGSLVFSVYWTVDFCTS